MGKWKMILAEVFAGAAFCLLLLMVFTFFLEENWKSGSFLMCSVLLLCLSWLFLKDTIKMDMAVTELEKKVCKMEKDLSVFEDIVKKVERYADHLSMLKDRIYNLEEKTVTGLSAGAEEKLKKELMELMQEECKKTRDRTGVFTSLQTADKGLKSYRAGSVTGSTGRQNILDVQKSAITIPADLSVGKYLPEKQYDKEKERVKLERLGDANPSIKEYIIYKDGRGTFWLTKGGKITPADFQEGDRLTKGMMDLIDASKMRGLFEIPRGDLVNKEVTKINPAIISLKNSQGTDPPEGILSMMGKIEVR